MPTIDPKTSVYINIAVAVLSFIAAGALPHFIPTPTSQAVAETAGYASGLIASINAALHAVSAMTAGPLVNTPKAAS